MPQRWQPIFLLRRIRIIAHNSGVLVAVRCEPNLGITSVRRQNWPLHLVKQGCQNYPVVVGCEDCDSALSTLVKPFKHAIFGIIHAAWFVDGKLTNRFINLGFDAADRPQRYAFEWLPDRIRWFTEDKMIFEVTAQETVLPEVPGFLFANIWAADPALDVWSGTPKRDTNAGAFVGSVKFTPLAKMQEQISANLKALPKRHLSAESSSTMAPAAPLSRRQP